MQFRATQIDVASSGPARAQPAPALWDSPPSAARLAATPCVPLVTMVPVETSGSAISAVTQSSAQSFDAGGSRYSPPERIQRALRLAHLHDESRKWHERVAALLAWAHDTQPGPVPLPMSKSRELHSLLPEDSTRALAMLRNTSPVRTSPVRPASRSPRPAQPELDTHRHRRPQEAPPPPAHCALPGSWNKDFLQELAREVTLFPWLQWTPTSGLGGHHQLKTRLGIIDHWRNGTAYIQGPSSHQLAGRILELREALRHESRAPIPRIHDIQQVLLFPALALALCHRPVFRLDHLPGLARTSPVQVIQSGGSANFVLLLFPTRMYLSCRLKVTQVNPKVSGFVGLVF